MRAIAIALLLAGSLAVLAQPASAHAVPEQMVPGNGTCMTLSPGKVWIKFTERLDPTGSSMRVEHEETRKSADLNDSRVMGATGKEMEVTLVSPLPPGNYSVFYATLSLDDGHPKPGSIVFEKRAEDDPTGGECAVVPEKPPDRKADPTWEDISLRATLFLSLYGGVGGLGFLLFVWDPLLRAGRPIPTQVVRAGYGRIMGVSLVALPVAILATLGIFALAASRSIQGVTDATLADGLTTIAGSSLGQAYIARIALLGTLAALVVWASLPALRGPRPESREGNPFERLFARLSTAAPGRFRDRRLLALAFALGAAAMATQSLSGHPSVFGALSVTVAADIVHQMAVTLWVGGLLHLLISVYPAIRAATDLQRGPLVYLSISRFSAMATVAVPVIVVSGSITAILLGVDTIDEIFGTTYGLILAAKVSLVMPVVLLGAYQKFVLIPDVEEKLPRVRTASPPNLRLGRFRRATQAEVSIGIAVLIVTAFLSSTSSLPALGPPKPSQLVMWDNVQGVTCINLTLIVSPYPTGPGSYNFDIFVTECAGAPKFVANSSLVFISPNATVPPSEVTLIPIPGVKDHPNHWLTPVGQRMRDAGTWTIYTSALNYTESWTVGPTFRLTLVEA
ncbi:MAG TPA: CopD family protein [Thermoplasmata archaeon]|nr:CopD family protein [Thermoplasmata archaeon]